MKSKRTLAVVAALAVVALLFAAAGYAYTASTTTTQNTVEASYYIVTPYNGENKDYTASLADAGLQLNTVNVETGITYTVSGDATNTFYYDSDTGALVDAEATTKTTIYKIATQKIQIDKSNIETPADKMTFKAEKADGTITTGFSIYYSVGAQTPAVGDKAAALDSAASEVPIEFAAGSDTTTMYVTFYAVVGDLPTGFATNGKVIDNVSFTYTATIAAAEAP